MAWNGQIGSFAVRLAIQTINGHMRRVDELKRIAATVILSVVIPAGASARDQRTAQLYWSCAGRGGPTEAAMCAGYFDGILDMHSMMVGFFKVKPAYCLPERGISIEQAMRVFIAWVEKNPDQMHHSARGASPHRPQSCVPVQIGEQMRAQTHDHSVTSGSAQQMAVFEARADHWWVDVDSRLRLHGGGRLRRDRLSK